MATSCYLRKTLVRLLDGNEYAFRALPFNRRTMGIMADLLEGDSDLNRIKALLDAVELSLGYDQTPEQVAAILDNGLIPIMPGPDGSDEARVHSALMSALVVQAGK